MRAINVLLSIVVSLVLSLLVFEVGLRLIGLGPPDTLNRPDDRLGWSKEPGKVVTRSTPEYDVELAINELGLRDDSMSDPKKAEGTFRVLMLGDSFTLGYSVAREDLFVDQLERWWQAENRRVDVINAGTEGYSTDQEVAWLLEHGDAYAPDLVLLFPYENDLYWNGQGAYVGDKSKPLFDADGALTTGILPPPPEKNWKEKLATTRLFNRGGQDVAQHLFTPEGGTRPLLKEWGAVLVTQPDFMADAIDRTRGALTALRRKCDELGAACFVVPIPSHSAVDPEYRARFGEGTLGLPEDRWDPDRPVNTFLTLASEVGLESLTPTETLRALTRNGSDVFYKIDWHLNELGNAELASFLHDKLDSDALGIFPATHQPAQQVAELPAHVARAEAPFWPKLFGILWVALTLLYYANYRDEPMWQPPLKVALLLTAIFTIFIGVHTGVDLLPPDVGQVVLLFFVAGILGFIVFKLGRRVSTILELIKSFVLRGHWYLLPLVVVLLTVGSLLVVAASSPLIAPFIYTLF